MAKEEGPRVYAHEQTWPGSTLGMDLEPVVGLKWKNLLNRTAALVYNVKNLNVYRRKRSEVFRHQRRKIREKMKRSAEIREQQRALLRIALIAVRLVFEQNILNCAGSCKLRLRSSRLGK